MENKKCLYIYNKNINKKKKKSRQSLRWKWVIKGKWKRKWKRKLEKEELGLLTYVCMEELSVVCVCVYVTKIHFYIKLLLYTVWYGFSVSVFVCVLKAKETPFFFFFFFLLCLIIYDSKQNIFFFFLKMIHVCSLLHLLVID